MKRILNFLAVACLTMCGAASVSAQALLNEVSVNPAGTDNPCEYIELKGTANAALTNLYFVSVEGDSGSAAGTADMVVNLTGQTLGGNGLLVIISPTPCGNRTYPAQTRQITDTQLDSAGGGLENGTNGFLLIRSATPIVETTDYDADNNGTLELLPADAVIVDGIGWTDGGTGDIVYGTNLALTGGTPGAATRFNGNDTANSAAAWYYGVLTGTPDATTYGTTVSTNFPTGGALTPGAVNIGGSTSTPRNAPVDYNGDGKTDWSVLRNSAGKAVWFTLLNGTNTVRSYQWGLSSDAVVPEDYDGDGKDDIAVWRSAPAGQAAFYILNTETNTVRIEQLGQEGDLPTVVRDYDGDGKTDPAIYRAPQGGVGTSYFYYRGSLNNPNGNITYIQWGRDGDSPVIGDFNGDGLADPTVIRDVNGQAVYIIRKPDGTAEYVQWGLSTDASVPGDYDGDGKTDLAAVRSVNGNRVWFIQKRAGGVETYQWGLATDSITPGDYDGDGKYDVAVWRGSIGTFFARRSSDNTATAVQWGSPNDYPAACSYVFNNF